MSGLLYGVGAVAIVAGAVMIGFGIPVNEFSFGNTLIGAGATSLIGGLIIVGLGAAVAQLQRIAETLATRTPNRSGRPLEMFESASAARAAGLPGRIPFPPKPKPDSGLREPHPPAQRFEPPAPKLTEESAPLSLAPTLRNPDEPPVTVEDNVSLSPPHPSAAPAAEPVDFDEPAPPAPTPRYDVDEPEADEGRRDSALDAGWRLSPPEPERQRDQQTSYFDAMWPESKPERNLPATESKPEPEFELPPHEHAPAPYLRAEPELEPIEPEPMEPVMQAEPLEPEAMEPVPRTVAILKSGVVDGMGYTLYVDGSIEAELPQGTLHFASINELRSHLERNA